MQVSQSTFASSFPQSGCSISFVFLFSFKLPDPFRKTIGFKPLVSLTSRIVFSRKNPGTPNPLALLFRVRNMALVA